MEEFTGDSLKSRLSKLYQTSSLATLAEVFLLVILGVSIVALSSMLRWPIKVPGHRGVEWMALLMTGRLVSRRRLGATISSASAAFFSLMPIWGLKDPLAPLAYFVPGILIDIGFMLSARFDSSPWAVGFLGAIAHASKPLVRLLVFAGLNLPYPSFATGIAYPVVLHALFGAIGAMVAFVFVRFIRRVRIPG